MMNQENEEKKDGADKSAETSVPVEPIKIKPADGEEIVLKPTDMALLVVLDTTNGAPTVYGVQHVHLRAYAKMLLNEALNLYNLTSIANTTVSALEQRMISAAKEKKPSLLDPFHKKG